jgi:hypothetical protein
LTVSSSAPSYDDNVGEIGWGEKKLMCSGRFLREDAAL